MAEITSILKPIAAPELTTPEYGQAVNTQFMNIKDNFEKLANRDFVKGESGQNLELIKIPIGIPNPDDNVLIINIEDIKSAIKTLFGLAPGDDRLKSVGNHDWDEGLKGGKFVHAYRIMDGEVYKYAFSEPIIFRDMRWAEIDDNNINDYAGIIDTSCVIYIDTDDSPYEFENIKFKAVASAPSLYYEDGDFKWRINGEKSGILARGPEGSHGTPGKTYILKAHRNDNNTGECIVTHIYQYNTAESTNADWISIEDIQDEDNKPVVGQSSIVVLDNGDIDGRHPGGYNYFYLSTIRSYKDSVDEKINYAVTCVDDVNGIPIAFDDIIFNMLLGDISEDADKSAMAGLFLPISSPAEDSTNRGSRAWVNSLSRHTIESSAEDIDGYRNKLTIKPVKGNEDTFEVTNAAININYPRVSFANPDNSEGVKFSHGINALATGGNSHAEGTNTAATGNNSHAEGIETGTSTGANGSHAEGYKTSTEGLYAHAEGIQSNAIGEGSHAEGKSTEPSGKYSHTEGMGTVAIGEGSHAEGKSTDVAGDYSHAEGIDTHTQQDGAHAEGFTTWATGMYSHAEGAGESTAAGVGAHAEGSGAHAIGDYSHAEGAGMDDPTETYVTAAGVGSHAEGIGTESHKYVYGDTSHAILADGVGSHAEGENTHAGGRASHAEGFNSEALGDYSHVTGSYNVARGNNSTLQGRHLLDYGISVENSFIWLDCFGTGRGCGYIRIESIYNPGTQSIIHDPREGYYKVSGSFWKSDSSNGAADWDEIVYYDSPQEYYISSEDLNNIIDTWDPSGVNSLTDPFTIWEYQGIISPGRLVSVADVEGCSWIYDESTGSGGEYWQRITEIGASGDYIIRDTYLHEEQNIAPIRFTNDNATIVGRWNDPRPGDIFEVGCGDDYLIEPIQSNAISVNSNGETTIPKLNSESIVAKSISANSIDTDIISVDDISGQSAQFETATILNSITSNGPVSVNDTITSSNEVIVGNDLILYNDVWSGAVSNLLPYNPTTWENVTGNPWMSDIAKYSINVHPDGEARQRVAKYATVIADHILTATELVNGKIKIYTGSLYGDTGTDGYGMSCYYSGSNTREVVTYSNHSIFIQHCSRTDSALYEGTSSYDVAGIKGHINNSSTSDGYLTDKFNAYKTSKMTYSGGWDTIKQVDYTPTSWLLLTQKHTAMITSRFLSGITEEISTTSYEAGDHIRVVYTGCIICRDSKDSGTPVNSFRFYGVGPFSTSITKSQNYSYSNGVYLTRDIDVSTPVHSLKSNMTVPSRYMRYLSTTFNGDYKTILCNNGLIIGKSQNSYFSIHPDSNDDLCLWIIYPSGAGTSTQKSKKLLDLIEGN